MTLEETRWNGMDGAQRQDWLATAGEQNFIFRFLDWQEIPEPLVERLIAVYAEKAR